MLRQSEAPPRAMTRRFAPRKPRQGVRAIFPILSLFAICQDGQDGSGGNCTPGCVTIWLMAHAWDFISDYETDPAELAQPELKHLAAVWQEQRERLETQDSFVRFNERLHREWAIETGLIERLYAFDRGVTQLLIEHGIDAALIPHADGQQPESVAAMIGDHQAAVESIFRFVRGERPLSTSYVKEMHALMTRNQAWAEAADAQGRIGRVELVRGDYKRWPNNPRRPDGSIHEYCPPEHVAAEMDRLIELHQAHVSVPPEVEAAWLHHRFTQIHPFQDGNGRIARALATLVFVKAGWFPLVVRNEGRVRYLDALELASRRPPPTGQVIRRPPKGRVRQGAEHRPQRSANRARGAGDRSGARPVTAPPGPSLTNGTKLATSRTNFVKALSIEPSLIRAVELWQATL